MLETFTIFNLPVLEDLHALFTAPATASQNIVSLCIGQQSPSQNKHMYWTRAEVSSFDHSRCPNDLGFSQKRLFLDVPLVATRFFSDLLGVSPSTTIGCL